MSLRQALYRFYWKVEKRLVPGLKSSQYHYYEELQSALSPTAVWLDIGCGHQVFGPWMQKEQEEVTSRVAWTVGMDPSEPDLRRHPAMRSKVLGDATALPFRRESFDVISANMVVEHLPVPGPVLQQIHAALQPGGRFVFHTTNYSNPLVFAATLFPRTIKLWLIEFLENRREEDVFPTHYRMNGVAAIRALAQQSGFQVASLRLVSTSAATVMLGPFVIVELLCTRLCQWPALARLRSNLVVTLVKSGRPL